MNARRPSAILLGLAVVLSACTRQLTEPPVPQPPATPTSSAPTKPAILLPTPKPTDVVKSQTFTDVPVDHPYYLQIEALWRHGFTSGCKADPPMFCPEATMNRAEGVVFIERGIWGSQFMPGAPTTQVFSDLPADDWAAKWASALWLDGYTSGCSAEPLNFCPLRGYTRAEGTVFYLRMMYGRDFLPPDAQGVFGDVPREYWAASWVEAATKVGLIPPCQAEPPLFCPDAPLTRAMAAFMLVQAKGIPLE